MILDIAIQLQASTQLMALDILQSWDLLAWFATWLLIIPRARIEAEERGINISVFDEFTDQRCWDLGHGRCWVERTAFCGGPT